MKLILLGPPGAGKGTQAVKLAEHFEIPHISTGDLFRSNISQGTELGVKAKRFIERGDLVPSELTLSILIDRLNNKDTESGFILDGFPRSVGQAESLKEILGSPEGGNGIDYVLSFVVPESIIVERTLSRGREDDTESVIRHRIRVYEQETAPLLDYYHEQLISIDALGTVDEVFDRVLSEIKQ